MSLNNLEQRLKTHIVGQDEAVETVSKVLRRSGTDIRNPTRPLASFLFAGPSAVGKKNLAKAIAIELSDGYRRSYSVMLFDLSDYDCKQFVSDLAKSIDSKPSSVILFCKIEKAHRDVCDNLLRIIEEGTLTNPKGHRGDFSKAVIVMTFDIAQNEAIQMFREGNVRQRISHFLIGIFGCEISNRVDEILLFNEVTKEHVEKIVEVMVTEFAKRTIIAMKIKVEVADAMKNRVVEEGYDPSCGAKTLKSAFARLVEYPLADAILERRIQRENSYTIDYDHNSSGGIIRFSRITTWMG